MADPQIDLNAPDGAVTIHYLSDDPNLTEPHEKMFVLLVAAAEAYLQLLQDENDNLEGNLITTIQGLGECMEARHNLDGLMFGPPSRVHLIPDTVDASRRRNRPITTNGFASWSEVDENYMLHLALCGNNTSSLAATFGRSERSVEQRLYKLGLCQFGGRWVER